MQSFNNFDVNDWIVFEDENVLVVNKPSGLSSHAGGVYEDNNLFDILKAQKKYDTLHLINRLDLDTSGLVLLAKNKLAAGKLNTEMYWKRIHKKYYAVTFGAVKLKKDESVVLDYPLKEKRGTHIKWKIKVDKNGQPAQTFVKLVEIFVKDGKVFSLVECSPITGRQHQIRVHLAHIGNPIVGDKIYVRDKVFKRYTTNCNTLTQEDLDVVLTPRLLLQSFFLEYSLDGTKNEIVLPVDNDLKQFMN